MLRRFPGNVHEKYIALVLGENFKKFFKFAQGARLHFDFVDGHALLLCHCNKFVAELPEKMFS